MSNATQEVLEITTAQAECLQNERLLASKQTREMETITVNNLLKLLGDMDEKKARSFATISCITEYNAGKSGVTVKSRADKTPAEAAFAFPIKKSYSVHFVLGGDYKAQRIASLIANGTPAEEAENLTVQKMSGRHHINRMVAESDTVPGQYYLCVPISDGMVAKAFGETVYVDNNGRKLTDEEVKNLKANFLRINKELPRFMTPFIENVLAVVVNGKVYEILSSAPAE